MRTLSKNTAKSISMEMGSFLQQYQKRAQKGQEPNDRRYDRGIEQIIRKLKPEHLDILINGESDDDPTGVHTSVNAEPRSACATS